MYQKDRYCRRRSHSYRRRNKRKIARIWKCICVFLALMCISVCTFFYFEETWNVYAFAPPEKTLEETGKKSFVLENSVWDNMVPDTMIMESILAQKLPVVFLDAGHGGADAGCIWEDIYEKDINLSIAKLVQDKLEERGYRVVMARDKDTYIAKEDRVVQANATQADIYVSIHQNFSEESDVSGMEVWYEENEKRDNKRLAQLIHQQTSGITGALQRELRGDAEFHVTGKTTMPSCLVETGFLSNKDERTKLSSLEYQEQIADGIVQGIAYYFQPKTMYLTFDDGPSKDYTNKVLDILKARNVKATFFLIGENARKYPDVVKRIAAEGHTIGIHCDNHNYEKLYQSADSYIQDFENARQTIYQITGVQVNIFRFPGGSVNHYNAAVRDEIIEEMTNRGYIYFDWNASLEDAVQQSVPEQLIANALSTTLGRKKVIMLAHDVVPNTTACLDELLDSFPEYQMKPLSEEVEPIQF